MTHIRDYQDSDEPAWLRCRVLAFLQTPYFDDVLTEKPRYPQPAIELVAIEDGQLAGLIDIEDRVTPGKQPKTGVIWNVAVHPDFQRRGIGRSLLELAKETAVSRGIARFEAWTRDDATTCSWYESQAFKLVDRYLHVYMSQKEAAKSLVCTELDLKILKVFAHYTGDDPEYVRSHFERAHECRQYALDLSASG